MFWLGIFVLCTFAVDKGNFAELIIRGPPGLVAELNGTHILGRPALFGFPEYNGQFVGHLRLAPQNNHDGCEEFNEQAFFSLNDEIIAVMDRGTCHFVTKVYNAQVAGAKGAIIVNHLDGEFLPFMADDGLGSVVDIPSILIQKNHGLVLKEWLNHQRVVETEIKWGLTRAGEAVEWILFTSVVPAQDEIQFVKDFMPVVKALGDRQDFQVRLRNQQFTYDGSDDCYETFYCFEGQVVNGHYVTGYSIVRETLRQLCIYQIGNQTNDDLLWWEYRTRMDERCMSGETCFDVHVSDQIIRDLTTKINLAYLIENCEQSSGTELLEEEQKAFQDYRVSWTPRITVNGDFYHGSFGGYGCPDVNVETCSLLAAMCSTFDEPIPAACEAKPTDPEPIIYRGDSSSLRSVVIFLVVGFSLVIVLGGVALFKLRNRVNQTNNDFQAMRNIYQPLDDDNQIQYPTDVNRPDLVQSDAV